MPGDRREIRTIAEQSTSAHSTDSMAYHAAADLRALRAFVCAGAVARGLSPQRVELLALAVSELATNTLQHTTGGGRVRLWAEADHLICDVIDQGPMRAFGRDMPPAEAVRGRGLAIVEQVCDEVGVLAMPEGTVVRIRLGL
ncbi:ATP-binding protein [Micromonospora sp. RHAY321]|uniref:ATP-binding protein n=1 Tax=Micromonospora sp. RHAY321 TaxID=2944807 RepID=UPI00207D3E45|nr:ATP-binding protein [Micromonospora sp. RHAY321]MCO1594734.1 ATP-binding protein [Micromonospora sp. RHAY321]